ncbi:MAG: DUF3124 domain-containing protein, partial [Deltaproteobacteria bacterium]|nr:DUF3124 domain-containing protein [Deltaproteobacteria bacterium]
VSIRNTDPSHPIRVMSAKYYDTNGKLLREYEQTPRDVPSLGTIEYFVEQRDTTGGSGANFLVRWESGTPINPPIIESVHVYFRGTQAMAFATPGRVIRTHDGD